jgi:hypothetical protein
MSLVLDCSITLAWLLPDEDSKPVQTVLDRIVAPGRCQQLMTQVICVPLPHAASGWR